MIDLHLHSRASDGSDSPAEVAACAIQAGIKAAALTDHDTVSGLSEFLNAARSSGLYAVPGVEISSMHHYKEVHILGLFIDPDSAELKKYLDQLRDDRAKRNRLMLEKLNIMGFRISEDELRTIAGGESIGRPHIASLLVQKGYFASIQDAFERCLRRGARGYISRTPMPPYSSINAIHAAGGLAFWAHPVTLKHPDRSMVRRFLRDMTEQGLDGIECYYSGYGERQTQLLKECSAEYDLLYSGGSDYHGEKVHPGIRIGTGDGTLCVPDDLLETMLKRLGRTI